MEDEYKNVRRKRTIIGGRLHDSKDRVTSEVVETEEIDRTTQEGTYNLADCGCSLDPQKLHLDEDSGDIVCQACCSPCAWCGGLVYKRKAARVFFRKGRYLCKKHRWMRWHFFLFAGPEGQQGGEK